MMDENKYKVVWKHKLDEYVAKLPAKMQYYFYTLVSDLRKTGPIQNGWPDFYKLEENLYYCHLGHSNIALWTVNDNKIIMELYYVDSR